MCIRDSNHNLIVTYRLHPVQACSVHGAPRDPHGEGLCGARKFRGQADMALSGRQKAVTTKSGGVAQEMCIRDRSYLVLLEEFLGTEGFGDRRSNPHPL